MKPNKISIKITQRELNIIKEGIDTLSGMIGLGTDFDNEARKVVTTFDNWLKRNNLTPRKFN